jgi:hypothetical protein
MTVILSLMLGLALATAAGLRVFVPLLIASLAARADVIEPAAGFAWLGSDAALILLATATAVEVVAYMIPWVDHVLDVIATPAAAICGTLLMAAVVVDLPEALRWTLAIVAGGGAAGLVQGASMGVRTGSTASTGGLANPVVSGAETVGASVIGGVGVVAPALGFALAVVMLVMVVRALRRGRRWLLRRAR